MENLAKGFVYPLALLWAGMEIIHLAANGTAWPLALAFAWFTAGFIVVGCYPLSDSAIEAAGRIFFSIAALTCLLFALASFALPGWGILKIAAAVVLCLVVFRPPAADAHGASASSH